MTIEKVREKSDGDLADRVREAEREIFNLRCVAQRLTPQQGVEIRKLRREIARIKTVQRERALKAELPKTIEAVKARVDAAHEAKSAAPKLRAQLRRLERTKRLIDRVSEK